MPNATLTISANATFSLGNFIHALDWIIDDADITNTQLTSFLASGTLNGVPASATVSGSAFQYFGFGGDTFVIDGLLNGAVLTVAGVQQGTLATSLDVGEIADLVVGEQFGGSPDLVEKYLMGINWTLNGGSAADIILATDTVGDNVVLNLRGNDVFNLGGGNDDVFAGDGKDKVNGGSGADKLRGGNDNDILNGGTEGDLLDGGSGTDTASYDGASAAVKADLLIPSTNTGDAAGDTYVSIENLTGSKFSDLLRGNASANVLSGGLGKDSLYGRDGNDTLIGGGGADVLNGGADNDTASYAGATAGLNADLIISANNTGDAAGDTYVAIERLIGTSFIDKLYGDHSANTIWGGLGKDQLYGRGGNDFFYGGAGDDILSGGAGGDNFVFDQALTAANVDKITDFSSVDDTIRIDNAFFIDLSNGTLSSAAFRANTTGNAGDSSDRIIYETDTGELYFDRDGTGATYASVHFATLTNFATLGSISAADFVVI